MQSGGSSCGTSSIAAPAMVMRCLTAETARKRTAGAGSQREEQRVDATRDLTEGISQKLEDGSGGGDESRQQRTERKEGTMFEKTVYKLQNNKKRRWAMAEGRQTRVRQQRHTCNTVLPDQAVGVAGKAACQLDHVLNATVQFLFCSRRNT